MRFINWDNFQYALKQNKWPVMTPEEKAEQARKAKLKKLYPNKYK